MNYKKYYVNQVTLNRATICSRGEADATLITRKVHVLGERIWGDAYAPLASTDNDMASIGDAISEV